MIAVIADLKESRKTKTKKREAIDRELRDILDETYKRFQKHCSAIPELTQGDSIELLVTSWEPIIFLFHRIMIENIDFRVGIGTGKIIVLRKKADECDGPAFWNAREALNEAKQNRYMPSMAGIRLAEDTTDKEKNTAISSILFLTTLHGMTLKQLRCCFYHLWEKKRVSQIAEIMQTTKSNVSKILNKTPCYLLAKILALRERN
ncbi:MAG: SatD family protein [Candidatus Thorarchaeota archaeon]|nr:SatD family protein [Candidatus Thorarchaeota archaeon]